MKHVNFICLSLLLCLFSACADESDVDPLDNLPSYIQYFIDMNIPDYTVNKVVVKEDESAKYQVHFEEDLIVVFNEEGIWKWFESNSSLPDKLIYKLTSAAPDDIKELYPDLQIVLAQQIEYGYRIGLSDKTFLAIPYSGTEIGADFTYNMDELPQNMRLFLTQVGSHFQLDYIIKMNPYNDDHYFVTYKNGIKINFDELGNWTYYDSYPFKVPSILIQTFPSSLRNYLSKDYPDIKIYAIRQYKAYYQLRTGENNYISVDPDTGAVIFPINEVNAFLEKHFGERASNKQLIYKRNPTIIYFDCKLITSSYTINMEIDKWGNWLTIDLSGKPILQTILDELPASILTYLHEMYPEEPILGMDRRNEQYTLMTSNEIIRFDERGNWIEIQPLAEE